MLPADTMMQPVGGQPMPMDDGKIFVGGLHPNTTQDSLRRYFVNYGEVVDCVLMLDNVTKRSRGFGFVTFKDTTSVQAVMNQKVHMLDGKQIDPKRAVPKGPGQSMLLQKMGMAQPGRNRNPHLKIFVGGISQTTTDEHVRQYFSAFGVVQDVKMPQDKKTGNHRGFAFVGFDSTQAVQKAQSTTYHQINGKTVEVKSLDENALRYNAPIPSMNGQYMGGHGEGYGQVGGGYGPAPGGGYAAYQGMGQQPSAYGQAPGAAAPPAYAGYGYGTPSAYGALGAGAAAGAAGYGTAAAAPGTGMAAQGRVDGASVSSADYASYSQMYGFGNYAQEASSYGPARSYNATNDLGSYGGAVPTATYGTDAGSAYGANAAAVAAAAAQNAAASVPAPVYQDAAFGRGTSSARGFHPYGR